jgi:hypothetical protein
MLSLLLLLKDMRKGIPKYIKARLFGSGLTRRAHPDVI